MSSLYMTPAAKCSEEGNLINFVETGVETGEGLAYAINLGFDPRSTYSCDIRKSAVDLAQNRFPESNIKLADSCSFLEQILPSLRGRTLFWLDAHYPAHYGVPDTDKTKMPLLQEIELIKKHKINYEKDYILCDDMRVFMSRNNPRYIEGEIPAYYYVHGWEEFVVCLHNTHGFSMHFVGEGVGLFSPFNRENS